MKLSFVRFSFQVSVAGHGMASEFGSGAMDIEYNRSRDMVVLGANGDEVPRSAVVQWRRDRTKEPPQVKPQCDICLGRFNNAQALGAHRKHKHGIKGVSHVAKGGGQ